MNEELFDEILKECEDKKKSEETLDEIDNFIREKRSQIKQFGDEKYSEGFNDRQKQELFERILNEFVSPLSEPDEVIFGMSECVEDKRHVPVIQEIEYLS